jgi:hypothetical protein
MRGPTWSNPTPQVIEAHRAGFTLLESETLAGTLAGHGDIIRDTIDGARSMG